MVRSVFEKEGIEFWGVLPFEACGCRRADLIERKGASASDIKSAIVFLVPYYVEQFKEEVPLYMVKHQVRPGITGYNQAYFRNSVEQNEKFENDVYYAEHISFWLDVKIFFLTIFKVLRNEDNVNTEPTLRSK